jgi:hypothetical protein
MKWKTRPCMKVVVFSSFSIGSINLVRGSFLVVT